MLRFLLDEHLSPTIAEQLRQRRPEIEIVSLQEWELGAYLGADDEAILSGAERGGWTLVTYDQRTVTPLLKRWGELGISHGGVIFVNRRTLLQSDIGGLVRALCQLWDDRGGEDWTDQVTHLREVI